MTPTERMPRIEAMRHALSDTRLEGLTIHPNDRAVLDAWARHELDLPQAIDRLHQLLDAQASTLTPDERQSRALASFPTLRLAELQCYGLGSDPPPISPPRLAVTFPPLTPAEHRVYIQEENPAAGQPTTPSLRSLEEQLAEIGALALASATRLATDEKWRLEIQKQLF